MVRMLLLGGMAVFLWSSCSEDAKHQVKEAEWYSCIDSTAILKVRSYFDLLNKSNGVHSNFRIYYLGKKKSIIQPNPLFYTTLDSLNSFIDFNKNEPLVRSKNRLYSKRNASYLVRNDRVDHFMESPFAFHIYIDTTQVIAQCYPFFLTNKWKDTVILTTGDYLPLLLEAKNKEGEWKQLQRFPFYGCGTGLKTFLLPPQEIALSFLQITEGDFETKIRLSMGFIHSNSIRGRISSERFRNLSTYD